MDYSDEENDISWLTQVPSLESQKANFNIVEEVESDNEFEWLFGGNDDSDGKVISLEENGEQYHKLYDNVVAVDISDDEQIENL